MDAKERLYSAATQQFDICIEKYTQKIKNCLWGMIAHAYNEGLKDGKKSAKKEQNDTICVGDEVGQLLPTGGYYNIFVVTDYEDGKYIGGLAPDGGVHFHEANEYNDVLSVWHKTGRHFDIVGLLSQMKQ